MHTLQAKWFFFFTLLKVNYRLIYILAAPVGGSSVAPPRARSSAPALPGSLSSRWSSPHLSLTSHQHTLSSIRGQPERAEVLTNRRAPALAHIWKCCTEGKGTQAPKCSSSDCSKVQMNPRTWHWMDVPGMPFATSPLLFRSQEFNLKVQ